MTIKEILLQEIESSPESLLEETLDFLRFLKTKQQAVKKDNISPQIKQETANSDTVYQPEENRTDSSQLPYRPASGRSILRHAGTWAGELVKAEVSGTPGKQLLRFAGSIPPEDLKLMQEAIEQDCERVDINEW